MSNRSRHYICLLPRKSFISQTLNWELNCNNCNRCHLKNYLQVLTICFSTLSLPTMKHASSATRSNNLSECHVESLSKLLQAFRIMSDNGHCLFVCLFPKVSNEIEILLDIMSGKLSINVRRYLQGLSRLQNITTLGDKWNKKC